MEARTAACLFPSSELLPEAWVSARWHYVAEPCRTCLGAQYQTHSATTRVKYLRVRYIHSSPPIHFQFSCLSVALLSIVLTLSPSFPAVLRLPFCGVWCLLVIPPCFLLEQRTIGNIGTRIDMGHIIMSTAADQGPLLNRVSMAQYTIAVVFVLLR